MILKLNFLLLKTSITGMDQFYSIAMFPFEKQSKNCILLLWGNRGPVIKDHKCPPSWIEMKLQVHRLTSDLLFQLSQVGLHQWTILWEEMALVSLSEELFGSQNQDDRAEMKFMVLMILFQNSKAALKQKFRSNQPTGICSIQISLFLCEEYGGSEQQIVVIWSPGPPIFNFRFGIVEMSRNSRNVLIQRLWQ